MPPQGTTHADRVRKLHDAVSSMSSGYWSVSRWMTDSALSVTMATETR